jgi:FkbM family methyltransferase
MNEAAHNQTVPPSRPSAIERGTAYLGNYTALTRTVHGHKIYVDTRDISLAPHLMLDGQWEPWITKVFMETVKPGMSVVDVGSNVGWYSLLASSIVGPMGTVVSFEANPHLVGLLRRSLSVNGFFDRAKVENKAAYSQKGSLTFNIFEQYMGSSSLFASEDAAAGYHDKITKLTVDSISLDEYFAPSQRVDYIKIDAEGAEPHVLRGAKRIMSENKNITIMMEFAPAIIRVNFPDIDDFFGELRSYGFDTWRIDPDGSLIKSTPTELKEIVLCDLMLTRSL